MAVGSYRAANCSRSTHVVIVHSDAIMWVLSMQFGRWLMAVACLLAVGLVWFAFEWFNTPSTNVYYAGEGKVV